MTWYSMSQQIEERDRLEAALGIAFLEVGRFGLDPLMMWRTATRPAAEAMWAQAIPLLGRPHSVVAIDDAAILTWNGPVTVKIHTKAAHLPPEWRDFVAVQPEWVR